jgi:hypothetical protein
MKTSLFGKLCSVWATPTQYRGETRETRTNPALYVTSYEEVQDLTLNPTNKGLVFWMRACASVYAPNGKTHKTSRQSLIFYLAKKEAAKAHSQDVQKFVSLATKKADSFIQHWQNCEMRNLPVTNRIIHFQPQASPVQEAIQALYHGKLQEVAEYMACFIESKSSGEDDPAVVWAKEQGETLPTLASYIEGEALESSVSGNGDEGLEFDDDGEVKENDRQLETMATMTVMEPRDKAHELLGMGLPFKETLEFLEQIEYAEMHKLPEYIGVSRFNEMERNPKPMIENRKKALFPKNTLSEAAKVMQKIYMGQTCDGTPLYPPGAEIHRDPETGREYYFELGDPKWDSRDTGGKISDEMGQIIDADGLFVKSDLWDNELTESNDLQHSPSQERAEERDVQRYFRYLEDKRTERMWERVKQIHKIQEGYDLQQAPQNLRITFSQMCQKARAEAMAKGVTVKVGLS